MPTNEKLERDRNGWMAVLGKETVAFNIRGSFLLLTLFFQFLLSSQNHINVKGFGMVRENLPATN